MDWGLFLTYLFACGAAAATGALIQPGAWYDSLAKPSWTPPNWVFPVVWTVLYIAIAYAGMRVALIAGSGAALAWWSVQIALNTLWTPVFFGLKRMGTGLVVIVLLWVAVAMTLRGFWALDAIAGLLFAPYLLWVTIATALNASVWWKNRGAVVA